MNVEIGYIGEMGYIEGEGVIQAAEELLEYRQTLQSWLVSSLERLIAKYFPVSTQLIPSMAMSLSMNTSVMILVDGMARRLG